MTLRITFDDDPAAPYEAALASGRFTRDPDDPSFLGRFTYLFSDELDGVIVSDSFRGLSNDFHTIQRQGNSP